MKKTSAKLTIELVPVSSWGVNLHHLLTSGQWDKVRRAAYRNAGYVCEVCGGRGPKHPVECHEVWHYDDHKKIQTLTGTVALCPGCHRVKHIGRSAKYHGFEPSLKHLMKVNGWTRSQAMQHVVDAFETWEMRSQYEWTVDLSWLEKFNG